MAYNIMETIKLHDLLPILDGVSDAVFIDDGAGHCVWCNSACEELYQISSSGTRGKHVKDLEKMGIFAPSVTRRVLEENREITIIHENKNGKKLLTTGPPVYNSKQEISLIITVSRDITQLTSKQDPSDADAGTVLPLNDIDGIEAPGGDICRSDCKEGKLCFDHRRIRRRQRSDRQAASRRRKSLRRTFRNGKLRGYPGQSDRIRAFRLCSGSIYRIQVRR